jgi:ATP-binding cassette subfamily B protein
LAVLGLVVGSVLGFLNLLLLKPAVEVLGGAARLRPAGGQQTVTADGGLRRIGPLQGVERLWGRLVAPIQSRFEAADASFQRYAASNRWGALWLVAVAMLGLAALKSVIESLCQYLLARSSYGMVADLHEDLFRKVIAQDYLFFVRHSTGYLESRIQSDVAALRRTLETLLRHGFQAPFQLLFLGILLLALNLQLTLIAMAVALPAALPLLYLSRVVRRVIRETRRQADQQGAALEESLRNFPLVKFFQSEPFEIEKFEQRNRQLLRSYLKNRLAQFGSAPLMQLVSAAGRSAVLIVGGYLVFGGRMDFSTLVVYLVALTRFYGPGRSLSRAGSTWPTLIVAAERMAEILGLQPAVSEAQDAQPLERVREGIEFKNVSFSYAGAGQIGNLPVFSAPMESLGSLAPCGRQSGAPPQERVLNGHKALDYTALSTYGNLPSSQVDNLRHEALDDVSFRIPVGRVVALVGPSGAGKTTLVCLLARLFDPRSGSIEIDGSDLRRFRLSELRRAIATVTQETILFNDTVARNIAYPDAQPDMARVIEAARAAHADEFITALDGGAGYDTIIGQSGQRLSGGQRQRIAIARALYRNPQILIFDEATSSLDEESQALVQDAIQNLFRGRTVLIIAHRLSTVRRADEILVLHQGRLIERGTHDELLRRDGFYASLCRISQGGEVIMMNDEV